MCLVKPTDFQLQNVGSLRPDQISRTFNGIGYSGLGLVMQNDGSKPFHSPTPTVVDDYGDLNNIPSTRRTSIDDGEQRWSPNRALMQQILNQRRQTIPTLPLNTLHETGINQPEEERIMSATEVATPSVGGTPDFTGLQQTIHETRALIKTISESQAATTQDVVAASVGHRSPASANHGATDEQPTVPIPAGALARLPGTLQRLLPYLETVHSHLQTYPHLSTSIKALFERVDVLENMSFSHVPMEELNDRFDGVDLRLLHLESRTDEHDKLHSAIEDEGGSSKQSGIKAGLGSFTSNISFRSNGSLRSTTSSALIADAIERQETGARLKEVEERLEVLESTALPSYAAPWEIEIILLPWGRDLRGIWFTVDDSTGQHSIMLESEDWTQAVRSSGQASETDAGREGWTSQRISEWADAMEQGRMWPKACGIHGLVYKRLQSRGLVRNATLRNPGAREIAKAVHTAFDGAIDPFIAPALMAESSFDDLTDSFLGLQAPIIPLRKVHKSSRLLFLSKPEMVTPVNWTAEFLSSSVIMRGPGGRKRLYVTTSAAYLQSEDDTQQWSWQRLRELPRVRLDVESQEVGEADARESCWATHPSLDPPVSTNSSFSAHSTRSKASKSPSLQLKQEELDDEISGSSNGGAGADATADATVAVAAHPLSPLSEFPAHRRHRSVSILEPAANELTQSKRSRRVGSAEAINMTTTVSKRRRLTRSPEMEGERTAWNFTPRRSREPPSPFPLSSQGRVPSDGTGGYAAYATPFSNGTVFGAGGGAEGGDTEVDSDAEGDDDVWEGVAEEDEEMEAERDPHEYVELDVAADLYDISDAANHDGESFFDDDEDEEEEDDDSDDGSE